MGKGISIGVASDTREFSKNLKDGVIKPLEDASDALDDVARDGDKAGDKLEKGFSDAAKGTSDFKREQSELGKVMSRSSKEGADAWKKNTKEATDDASEGFKTVKQEAVANASETFSSFDGSVTSLADGIQGTLGGIVSDLGPIGAAAGAAGAIGVGLIMAAFDRAGTDSEEFRAQVAELGQEFIDTGGIGEASLDFIIDKLKSLATETDDGKDSLKKMWQVSKDAGTSFEDLAAAYVGNGKELDSLITKNRDLEKATNDALVAAQQAGKPTGDLTRRVEGLSQLNQFLDKTKTKYDEAAEQERLFIESGGHELQAKSAAIDAYADAVGGAMADAAGSWADYKNAETGALDPAAYLAGIQARIDATNAYSGNLATIQSQLSPEAFQRVLDEGIDFSPMLAAIIGGGPEVIAQFNSTFSAAAAVSNAAVDGIRTNVTVTTTADTKPATADLFKVRDDKSIITTVGTRADTSPAVGQIRGAAAQDYSATIRTSADLSQAEADLSRFMNRARTITINASVVDSAGRQIL